MRSLLLASLPECPPGHPIPLLLGLCGAPEPAGPAKHTSDSVCAFSELARHFSQLFPEARVIRLGVSEEVLHFALVLLPVPLHLSVVLETRALDLRESCKGGEQDSRFGRRQRTTKGEPKAKRPSGMRTSARARGHGVLAREASSLHRECQSLSGSQCLTFLEKTDEIVAHSVEHRLARHMAHVAGSGRVALTVLLPRRRGRVALPLPLPRPRSHVLRHASLLCLSRPSRLPAPLNPSQKMQNTHCTEREESHQKKRFAESTRVTRFKWF